MSLLSNALAYPPRFLIFSTITKVAYPGKARFSETEPTFPSPVLTVVSPVVNITSSEGFLRPVRRLECLSAGSWH